MLSPQAYWLHRAVLRVDDCSFMVSYACRLRDCPLTCGCARWTVAPHNVCRISIMHAWSGGNETLAYSQASSCMLQVTDPKEVAAVMSMIGNKM